MKKIILLALCTSACFLSQADPVDSLRVVLKYEQSTELRLQSLETLARLTLFNDSEESKAAIQEGIEITTQNGLTEKLGTFYYLWGYQDDYFHRYGEAYKHFYIAHQEFEKSGSRLLQAMSLEFLGYYLIMEQDYSLAEEYLNQAMNLYIEKEEYSALANLQYRLGQMYFDQQNWDIAIQYFQLSLAFYQKDENHLKVSVNQEMLARIEIEKGNLDQAEAYLSLTESSLSKINDNSVLEKRASIFNNYALLAEKRQDTATAIQRIHQAYSVIENQKSPSLKRLILNNLAYWEIHGQGDYFSAKEHLELALEETDLVLSEEFFRTYNLAVEAYTTAGDLERALALEKERNAFETSQQLAQLEQQKIKQTYEVMAAQAQLEVMDIQEARVAERQHWWIAIAGILLLAAAGVYAMYRKAMKHKAKAEANATHWPELNKRMQALEDALNVLY
ncbi:MAG TPA: hypothetical protein DCE41_19455 [Cytophagales bacterium]|nr:hypothetical protein [Cytophagales bacterium]HAA18182.1 hypothetical protein [Cytophagales bacterium]HAP59776.1 hypothetical protein [Cytophagales bacterium]